jgi:hypothetical protein
MTDMAFVTFLSAILMRLQPKEDCFALTRPRSVAENSTGGNNIQKLLKIKCAEVYSPIRIRIFGSMFGYEFALYPPAGL